MIRVKIRILILILSAVFACTAPFVHILYPKKSPQFEVFKKQLENNEITKETYDLKYEELKTSEKFIGFTNIRKFLISIGKPIAMLYFALLLIYIYPFIALDRHIQRLVKYSAILFLFISLYFITWTLWHRQDFPKELYYWAIGIVSIIATVISIVLINYNQAILKNLHSLMKFIVIDVKDKYVSTNDKREFVEDYIDEIEKLK